MGRGAGWNGQMKKVGKWRWLKNKWAVSTVQHVLWIVAVPNTSWLRAVRGCIRLLLQLNRFGKRNERRRTNCCLHVLITNRPTCLSAFCVKYQFRWHACRKKDPVYSSIKKGPGGGVFSQKCSWRFMWWSCVLVCNTRRFGSYYFNINDCIIRK